MPPMPSTATRSSGPTRATLRTTPTPVDTAQPIRQAEVGSSPSARTSWRVETVVRSENEPTLANALTPWPWWLSRGSPRPKAVAQAVGWPRRQAGQVPHGVRPWSTTGSPTRHPSTLGAHALDHAGPLVAEHHGRRERRGAVDDVEVALAHAGGQDPDRDLPGARLRDLQVVDHDQALAVEERGRGDHPAQGRRRAGGAGAPCSLRPRGSPTPLFDRSGPTGRWKETDAASPARTAGGRGRLHRRSGFGHLPDAVEGPHRGPRERRQRHAWPTSSWPSSSTSRARTPRRTSGCTSTRRVARSAPAWPSTTPCSSCRPTWAPSAWAWPPRWASSCSPPAPPASATRCPHSRILMHQPLGGVQGQASDIAIQAEQMAYIKRLMAERIAHHSGQTGRADRRGLRARSLVHRRAGQGPTA